VRLLTTMVMLTSRSNPRISTQHWVPYGTYRTRVALAELGGTA